MSRGRVLAVATLAAALAGCAPAVDPTANPERPYEGLAFDISEVPPELRVREPKDLRNASVCDLLTDAQLTELGLRADTKKDRPTGTLGRTCIVAWVDDPLNSAGIGKSVGHPNPVLPGLYIRREALARFEPLEIAGHPGARADVSDDGSCELAIATSDDQFLGLTDNVAGRPMADPCARPRRMAELILPTLPPRR